MNYCRFMREVSKIETLSEEGILLFALHIANRRRTAAGTRRTASSLGAKKEPSVAVVRGSCRLPRFVGTPGPVNRSLEQPGEPTLRISGRLQKHSHGLQRAIPLPFDVPGRSEWQRTVRRVG